jgi:hypothetical protein
VAIAASLLVLLAAALWFGFVGPARRVTAFGAPPAQVAAIDLARLRAQFDAEAGRTRVLALLSPS